MYARIALAKFTKSSPNDIYYTVVFPISIIINVLTSCRSFSVGVALSLAIKSALCSIYKISQLNVQSLLSGLAWGGFV